VFFKKIDCVPDFERKLVGLQLFTGDSGHENLRLEFPILPQWDRPPAGLPAVLPAKDPHLPIDTARH
jgi:hypothetical protein